MTAPADNLLARLNKVKQIRPNVWNACCPAHDDKHPSLQITELEDGRLLVHCFALCPPFEIVSAVGLDLSDLFPPSSNHQSKPIRHPFTAGDALRCLAFEATYLVITSRDIINGKPRSEADHERLILAAERVGEAERRCHAS